MPIFDQGYQHWSGELSGHAWRWLAITRHGVRIGMKNWLLRIAVMLAWLPAIGLAFMLCVWGLLEQKSPLAAPVASLFTFLGSDVLKDPKAYRVEFWTIAFDTFLLTELRFSMILILLVGPSLISQDLRFNALPLYFSRPLRRFDYFAGKLGVVGWFLAMVLIFPSIIAYLLGLLFSLDLSIIPDTFPMLLAAVGYGIVMTTSTGLFILALSSLSRNSRYVGLFWLAVWFVSSLVGTVLEAVNKEHQRHARYRANTQLQASRQAVNVRTNEQLAKHMKERQDAEMKAWQEAQAAELEDARRDWRPMVSYTGNLARIGQEMLQTDKAWRRFAENQSPEMKTAFLQESLGPQYPWYWSAGLLAGLAGLSALVLNFRVKSLDRLK